MALQYFNIKLDGRVVAVAFRLVYTPFKGYQVEFEGSTALLEIRMAGVILRTAYGKWNIDILKKIKDYIQSK